MVRRSHIIRKLTCGLFLLFAGLGVLAEGREPALAADDGNTIPCEFGGVRMGAFLSDLEGMVKTRVAHVEDEVNGDFAVAFYTHGNVPRDIVGIALDRVEYGFCEEYLCIIRVEARGDRTAFDALVAEYARQYGTEDRRVYLYGSEWDRFCDEERAGDRRVKRWVLCEHETDNCAVFSITFDRAAGSIVLQLGDQYEVP